MIVLIQRVTAASVVIDADIIASINTGLLAFIGIEKKDTEAQINRMAEKMLLYRVFTDKQGKMNLSLKDIGGGILLISQFTLLADTRKGLRPSFSAAAPPAQGALLFGKLVEVVRAKHAPVGCGVFGADMQVSLINDGPVTFWLQE